MSQNVAPEKRTLTALALASDTPIAEAAEQAGVCRRTVERWLARPAFRRLVSRIRGQMLATALGYMTDNMTRAARTVAELLDAPEAHVRLRAARTLMTFGLRFRGAVYNSSSGAGDRPPGPDAAMSPRAPRGPGVAVTDIVTLHPPAPPSVPPDLTSRAWAACWRSRRRRPPNGRSRGANSR